MNIFQKNFDELYTIDDSLFSVSNLANFSDMLNNSNSLIVFGSGSSFVVAQFISDAINWCLGKSSYALTTRQLLYRKIINDDLLLISYSGSTYEIQNYNEILKKTNLLTISPLPFTNSLKRSYFAFDNWERRKGFNISEAVLIPCTFCYQALTNNRFLIKKSIEYWHTFLRKLFSKKTDYSVAVFYGDFVVSAAYDIKVKFEESALGSATLYEKREFSHGKFISFQNASYDYIIYLCQNHLSTYERDLITLLKQKFGNDLIVMKSQFTHIMASIDLLVAVQCLFYELTQYSLYDLSSPPYKSDYLALYKKEYFDF